MTLQELRYLVALADTKHFGRAAALCNVSQPTLSAQLKKLEESLGAPLVERTARRVMLTPVGADIVARARQIFDHVRDIRTLADGSKDGLSGPLRLGVIPTLAPYVLPYLVPYWRKAAPSLQPHLREEQTERLLAQLRDGTLDAGLLALPLDGDDLETQPWFDEPFVLAVPKGHPLAKKDEVSPAVLGQEKLLLLEDGHCLRAQALEVCTRYGSHGRDDVQATSLETLRHMVAAGLGVTLLPKLAVVRGAGDGVHVCSLGAKPPTRRVGWVWRKGFTRAEALRGLFTKTQISLKLPLKD
jgi:LysR family hydrogen peroxide-inducible transcriptional activator